MKELLVQSKKYYYKYTAHFVKIKIFYNLSLILE